MAVKILTSSATLSSGSNWKQCEASSLTWANSANALNTERTQAVTFANAGNQQGIYLYLFGTSATWTAGTLTIKLQSADGLTTYTTDTFTMNTTLYPGRACLAYFPLTSYAVTTAASTWRYAVSYSNATMQWIYSTGPVYFYAVALDYSTAKPSTGDTIIIADSQTLTFNESASWDCVHLGMNSVFQWETQPLASYTLTITGAKAFKVGTSWSIKIGTETYPNPYAQQAIIDMTAATGNFISHYGDYYHTGGGWTYPSTDAYLQLYGAEDDYMQTRIAAQAAQSQAVIVTTADMSSYWQAGDTVTLYGKTTSSADSTTYTISTIVGTTITLSANLNYILLAGGAIVNQTRAARTLGIKIMGPTAGVSMDGNQAGISQINMRGIYLQDISNTFANCTLIKNSTTSTFKSLYVGTAASAALTLAKIIVNSRITASVTVQNCHRFNGGNVPTGVINLTGGSSGYTVTNVTCKNSPSETYGEIYLNGNNMTLSGLVSCPHSQNYFNQRAIGIIGSQITATDLFMYGSRETVYMNCNKGTFTNIVANGATGGATTVYTLYLSTCVDLTFNTCTFGVSVAASGGSDIYIATSSLVTCVFNDCTVGTSGIGNTTEMIEGSYLKFHDYATTTNDHRTWWKYGYSVSTGDSLTDTTVHTSGTGKFALRFEPLSSANNLEWEFDVPTGNIQNNTMFVGVWCKINNAAYYAGTHQLPRLTVDYDNGTTAYAQAAESTDWQLLVVPITPTTTYGQITCTLSARTDQTTTNAYVYFDDFMVAYPPNVSLDLGGMDVWANALPVVPPLAVPISAKTVASAVWEELTTSHTTAGSLGKKLSGLKNPALLLGGQVIA